MALLSPHFEIMSPQGRRTLDVDQDTLRIGRQADNEIALDDELVSRFHAVIERVPEGYRIRDLDSRNGTWLNGEPVKASLLLAGDVVTIGNTELRLVIPRGGDDLGPDDTRYGGEEYVNRRRKHSYLRPSAAGTIPTMRAEKHTSEHETPHPLKKTPPAAPIIDHPAKPAAHETPRSAHGHIGSLVANITHAFTRTPASQSGQSNHSNHSNHDTADLSQAEFDQRPEAHDEYFRALTDLANSLPTQNIHDSDIKLVNARGQERVTPHANDDTHDAIGLLRLLLLVCFRGRATDAHIEPKADGYQLRVRIDGSMVEIVRFAKPVGQRLVSVVKLLSDVDIMHKSTVQEGHFSALLPDRRVDYRVSFSPAMFGQNLVIRVLDTANTPLHLADLNLPGNVLSEIRQAITRQSGMILVAGPTGSGKSTTLYAVIRDLDRRHRNIVTIEDPVEIQIDGVVQTPVNDSQGNTFAALLRSVLRQGPDAILVGEIRDSETAAVAMQAAMTGALVFSTVHARDTVSSIIRLRDLGVESYMIAAGLQHLLSQRLIRQLCPFCKLPATPTDAQLKKMGKAGESVEKFFVPVGCTRCLGTGFIGRHMIMEVLNMTDVLRGMILKSYSLPDLQTAALSTTDFIPLAQSGYQLAASGISSFDEVERAVGI